MEPALLSPTTFLISASILGRRAHWVAITAILIC